jgi:hypothetical protein
MVSFDKETRKIKKLVGNIVDFTINELKDKGLISLYVAGTILTKDRTPQSDIDLFGITTDDFNFNDENKLNKIFEERVNSLCEGKETRFRAFPLCVLEEGKRVGVSKYLHPKRILRRFPFFTYVYGRKFDFKKDFPLKTMGIKEEALFLIKGLKQNIKDLRTGKEIFPYTNFPKHVVELIRVEAEKDYGFKYDPSYAKLTKHLRNEEDHIIHRVMGFRGKKAKRREIVKFCDEAEKYIADLNKRVVKWK